MDPQKLLSDLTPTLVDYGVRVLGALVAFFVALRVASWLQRTVTRTLERRAFDTTLTLFFGQFVRYLVLTAAILACLGLFGIETTSFAAILGAASLAIGFAFQGTLGHFAAGVMILVFRPFKVGDLVTAAGQTGTVAEIGLFTVALDGLDNRRIIVPNSSVTGGPIANFSFHPKRRVEFDVTVPATADVHQTRQVLAAAAASVEGRDPEFGHEVALVAVSDAALRWQVRVWTSHQTFAAVNERTMEAVKAELARAGILPA